jgi:hypothetical protein
MPESTKELSGRELDGTIAELVMGWRKVQYNRATSRLPFKWTGIPPDGHNYRSEIWHFSSSIEAAMQVVEKLITAKWKIDIQHGDEDDDEWEVILELWIYGKPLGARLSCCGYGQAATLPEAICRAALEAFK